MKKTIWKYELIQSTQDIETPISAKVLSIQNQNGRTHVWIEVDKDNIQKQTIRFEKVQLTIESHQLVNLPALAVILHVDTDNNMPYMWAVYATTVITSPITTKNRQFGLIPTGELIESKKYSYLGSVQYNEGRFVQHLYEFFDTELLEAKTQIETKFDTTEPIVQKPTNTTTTATRTELLDKIKGVVYGHAIGDAIGLGTEFLSKRKVKQYYPDGYSKYSQIIADKHRARWKKGEWTDDTDQMLCVLESILDKNRVDELDVAARIHNWAYSGGRGLGNTVYKVISSSKFLFEPHEAAMQVWTKSGGNIAANGAVMRTAVLGVWDYNNAERMRENTEKVAMLTHFDPRCVASCYGVTYVISELIKGETDYRKLHRVATLKASEYDTRVVEYMNLSQSMDISTLQLDERNAIGYTLKALAAGFWALQQGDYKTALIKIVNEGGDADTNGAVAGGILGAKFGFSGLPTDWVAGLLNKPKLDDLIDRLIQLMKL